MESSLRYIEDYFSGRLTTGDREVFEQKCETDPAFAQEVALYLNMRGALRSVYYESKKEDFKPYLTDRPGSDTRKMIPVPLVAWVSGIAATILVAALVFFYFDKPDPQQLANTYIDQNLTTISVTMGAEQDSLALGVNAYNDQDYALAAAIFENLLKYPSVRFNGIKYLGMIALTTGKYPLALAHFDSLSRFEGMYANPGMFYKALTLMQRSESDDVQEAKKILTIVVREQMAGYKEAERWLEALD